MNKGELIAKIAEAGLSKKDAGVALDAAIAAVGDALAKGESVQLIGFASTGIAFPVPFILIHLISAPQLLHVLIHLPS